MRYLPSPDATRHLTTDQLREHFLLPALFADGEIRMELVDLERVAVGGAVPRDQSLILQPLAAFGTASFCERRELGILNIGGSGTVHVDGQAYAMEAHDALYVGRGSRDIGFTSADPAHPARFYLVSYPAHATYPTRLIRAADADVLELGEAKAANRRRIRRYIHANGAQSCQLVMGVTVLESGNVWNTMPAHTHERRSELYLYFALPADALVVHLLGEPTETRAILVRNEQVALSPGWSVHTGCGTQAYAFCWAMGGENQDYADMQSVPMDVLR